MTKRKVGAGGYAESSDESSDHATPLPPPKKPNVPITISRSAQPSARTFQLPTPTAPTVIWSSAPKLNASAVARTSTAAPLARKPQVAMPTPEETLDGYESSEAGSQSASPAAAATARKASKPGTSADTASGTKGKGALIPQLRSRFALEGKVDGLEEGMREMAENIRALDNGAKERDAVAAERDAATNKRLDQQDEKLNRLLALAERFPPPQPAQPAQPTQPAQPNARTGLSNPLATPELRDLVKEVCSASAVRARVGKKDKDNEVKAYVRKVLWKTCGVSSSSDVRPWQQNEDGSLDVFPVFLRDEKTGYGIPCPNWVVCLSEQVEWVPTYLERFRSMIPNDGSALSAKLRDQSDEQIVIRLRDGPLQTIKANWKAMDLEPEAMAERRSKAKQNAWLDRKVLIRERYRDELSGLQGPEHDYLFNKGFVSPEVSDGEGGRIVEQPEYRARWVNNLIDAIDMASAQASKARPGHRDPPPRKHIVVKCEVPNLLACTGSKGAIRIAACALSRKWRKANQSVVSQSPRINPLLKDPPNIDCFLEKYPTSTPEDAYDENPLPTADNLENDGGDEGDGGIGWGDSGIGLSRGEDEDWAEPGTQEGVVKEGGGNMGEVVGEEGEQDAWDALDVGEGATSMGIGEDGNQNFPLDPVLGGKSSHTMPAPHTTTPIEPANHTVADADPVAPTGQGPHTNSVAPTAPAGTPAPVSIYVPPDSCPHHPPMRSPPLLPASVSEPAPQDPAAMQASTSKLAKKKKAVAEPKLDVNGQPIKPRRGRPPGSKNKPKGDKVVN